MGEERREVGRIGAPGAGAAAMQPKGKKVLVAGLHRRRGGREERVGRRIRRWQGDGGRIHAAEATYPAWLRRVQDNDTSLALRRRPEWRRKTFASVR